MSKFINKELIIWLIVFQTISFAIGTIPNTWYVNAIKSSLTPPKYFFPIVWSILYFILAYVGYKIFKENIFSSTIKFFYVLQMVLNFSWRPIFFGYQMIKVSALIILVMIILTFLILQELYKKQYFLYWILLPYLIWILFAEYLTIMIVILN